MGLSGGSRARSGGQILQRSRRSAKRPARARWYSVAAIGGNDSPGIPSPGLGVGRCSGIVSRRQHRSQPDPFKAGADADVTERYAARRLGTIPRTGTSPKVANPVGDPKPVLFVDDGEFIEMELSRNFCRTIDEHRGLCSKMRSAKLRKGAVCHAVATNGSQ